MPSRGCSEKQKRLIHHQLKHKMKNQNQKQYRQGDVFLKKVNIDLSNSKIDEKNILAYGEGSGHVHILDAPKGVLRIMGGKMYVVVDKKTSLNHIHQPTGKQADHNPIIIEAGTYEVVIQREFNPYEKAAQQVID